MSEIEKNMLLARYVVGRENALIEKYISAGPTALREDLGLNEEQWTSIFDHLVFKTNMLDVCVKNSKDFFQEQFIKHGATHLREVLNIVESKYNKVWERIFDFIAVANDALYHHVLEHRDRYIVAFRARGGDFIRKVLGIWKDKYEENWAMILNLLLHGVCDGLFSENTYEHGMRKFTQIVNGMRVHRPVEKSEIARQGLV
jgi:hypothetical protein